MFTGIVEELGTVRAVDAVGDGRRLVVAAETVLDDVTLGASVAVNGCCLTVVEWGDEWFAVDAVPETIDERAVNFGARSTFHFIENHNLALNAAKSIGLTVVNIGSHYRDLRVVYPIRGCSSRLCIKVLFVYAPSPLAGLHF